MCTMSAALVAERSPHAAKSRGGSRKVSRPERALQAAFPRGAWERGRSIASWVFCASYGTRGNTWRRPASTARGFHGVGGRCRQLHGTYTLASTLWKKDGYRPFCTGFRPIHRGLGGVITSEGIPPVGASVPRKITAGLIGLAALTSLSLAAVSGWLTPRYSASVEGVSRGILGAMAAVFGYMAVRVLMKLTPPTLPRHNPAYQPDIDWLARLQEDISKPRIEHEPGALITFIDLITGPSQYRSRVAETIDLHGRSINKQVSVEFVLPNGALQAKSLYLPILQPVMGDLVDNFSLTDGSNSSLTNLSYLETVELAAIGLRTLLLYATEKPYQKWTSTRAAELIFLELIARRKPSDARTVKSSIKKGLKLLEGKVGSDAKDLISAYLRSLSAGYPIVAVVPQDLVVSNRVLLRYELTVIPASRSAGWEGKLRLGIGVRPSQVTVPVDLAMTSGSYHLRVNGPPEKYVVEQILRCANCRQRLDDPQASQIASCNHASGESKKTHFHLRGRFGQSFTHLYMRGFAEPGHRSSRYEILVRFNETPPGSRASAAVTALAALTFIWVIGHLSSNHEAISNSDLPAILLALPAVAASWVGLSSSGEALVGSSLHARLSLILTGLLSVTSVVIYLLQNAAADGSDKPAPARSHMTLAGVSDPRWITLLILAFLGFIYISWHLLARVRNYMGLIGRSDPLTTPHSMV